MMRGHHDFPWLLPGIGWALVSVVVGTSYARAHAWSGIWILVALVGAGVSVALVFAMVSVTLGCLLLRIAETRKRAGSKDD
jgi:hypothetical protein